MAELPELTEEMRATLPPMVTTYLAALEAAVAALTARVTVFHIDPSRGSQVVRALLGAPWAGVVGSDRFSAYRWLAAETRQVCWAHLGRDFQKLVEWGPGPRPVGARLLALRDHVFELWHRYRAGELDRAALALAISRVAAELHAVL